MDRERPSAWRRFEDHRHGLLLVKRRCAPNEHVSLAALSVLTAALCGTVPFAAALATIDVLENGGIAQMERSG